MKFTFGGNDYNFIYFSDLKESDLPEADIYGKTNYLSLNCGFDIETSSFKEKRISWMYVWQFAINDMTIIGRTWDEFRALLNLLYEHYELNEQRRVLCWIHNFSYEFQFIKNQVKWYYQVKKQRFDVFAMEDRKIVKGMTSTFIEFRDSLVLTNKSLKVLAKDYEVGIEKLPDYNYNIVLTPESKLHLCQIAYCINDVQILARFNQVYIKQYFMRKNIAIPLTMTAIPRNELKTAFRKLPAYERNRHKRTIVRGFPNMEDYETLMRWVYRGGYVHANASTARLDFELEDMGSVDFKSSYPAVLLHEDFADHFIERPTWWFYKYGSDLKVLKKYSYYGFFTFKNIRAKTPHTLESSNKIYYSTNAKYDNGRLSSSDEISVYLTELDYLNYLDMYSFDSVECHFIRVGEKHPLPKFFKDIILRYFVLKESLEKGSFDQKLTKGKLNALYGMCCTSLFNLSLNYNPQKCNFDVGENGKTWEKIVSEQILSPYYGVWCSAYARRNLVHNLVKVGYYSAFYCDTDSIKLRNYIGNKWVFETYNDKMQRINNTMYVGEYDRKYFKDLGKFDFEGKLFKMRFLGAKRYIYTYSKNGVLKTEAVVAGMRKGTLQKKAKKENKNIYELFDNGLVLDETESEKITTDYRDEEFNIDIVDTFGLESHVHELSCVTLYEIPFKMTMAKDYIEFIEYIQGLDRLRIGNRYS